MASDRKRFRANCLKLSIQGFGEPRVHRVPASSDEKAGRRIWRWRAVRRRFEFSVYKEVIKALAASEDKIKFAVGIGFDQASERFSDRFFDFESECAPNELTKTIIIHFEIIRDRASVSWLPIKVRRRRRSGL